MFYFDQEKPTTQRAINWRDLPARKALDLHRLLDLVLVTLSAPIALVLIAVLLTPLFFVFGKNILFWQVREGRNGKLFRIVKMRTLDSKSRRPAHKYCAFLRKHSFDELPQIWNVLRGEMALVGPRCHVPNEQVAGQAATKIAPNYRARLDVRPGMTGLAQVSGYRGEMRSPACLKKRVALDLTYIQNRSVMGDIKIIVQTIIKELLVGSGR
jgi:lipopolysaccharide/colanic/teichoic acid biosynthesis glycosyltransferase